MSAHQQFMNWVGRMPGISVFPNYIKRNDTLFADAPEFGVPVVLRHYGSGSHQSVVDGLEDVTATFSAAVGI